MRGARLALQLRRNHDLKYTDLSVYYRAPQHEMPLMQRRAPKPLEKHSPAPQLPKHEDQSRSSSHAKAPYRHVRDLHSGKDAWQPRYRPTPTHAATRTAAAESPKSRGDRCNEHGYAAGAGYRHALTGMHFTVTLPSRLLVTPLAQGN